MTDHIYGRTNILGDEDRPHMFLKELKLNVDYLKEQANDLKPSDIKQMKDVVDFAKQLLSGIEYYRGLTNETLQSNFKDLLSRIETEIYSISKEILERFETK
jgi:hypothetical protein